MKRDLCFPHAAKVVFPIGPSKTSGKWKRAVSLQKTFYIFVVACGVIHQKEESQHVGSSNVLNLGPKMPQTHHSANFGCHVMSRSHRISAKKTLVEVGQFASLEGIGQVFNTRPWLMLPSKCSSLWRYTELINNYSCIPGCYFHLSPSCIFFHWIEGPTVSPHMVLLDMFWCSWVPVDFDSNSVPNTTKQIIWPDLVKLFHLSLSLSSSVFLMMPENSWKWTSLLWTLCGACMSVRITRNKKDIGAEKLQKRSLCLFTRGKQKVYVYLRPIAITSHPQL